MYSGILDDWRRSARLFWYRADKGAWVFAAVVFVVVAALGFALGGVFAERDARRERLVRAQQEALDCLARNVYFEARGEPLAGQYAVAEVTMNRTVSRLFPRSVCDVVHEKGAFSWTDLGKLPEPAGEEWQRAQKVAEAVYFGRRAPALDGALFYHATRVRPDWAKDKKRVIRIGRHVFYR